MRFIVEYDIDPYSKTWDVRIPIGTTTTDVYTNPTTQTVRINGSSITASDKDVVIFKNHRYAWNATLGRWLSPFDRDRSLYPRQQEDYNDERFVLWHPDRVNDDIRKGYCIYNMQVKKQINHADSFTFVMPKGHPAYNIFSTFDERRLLGISVAVRWENSNQCLFFGRAVSISTDIYYQKTVTCEGCFAFLNDIMLRPTTFLASDPNPVEPVTPTQNGNESSSSSTTTTLAKESDPLSYDYRTKQWHEYADYVMRKHSVRMCDIAKCYKRSFRYAVRQSGPFSPDVPEYVDLGYTTANIIENQHATTLMVRNPLTGVESYVTPKQYDMVTDVHSTRWVKFVCDYNNAIPRASLIWRYPTTEEAQPAQEYQDNWGFSEMSARTAGTTLITDQDKRWTGVDDYTPVMDAINDIIGTDSRYIGYAYATIGMGNVNPSDNNVRLFLYVHSPQIATRHNSTMMDITKNVVDISESGNSFETYSALIPLDKNKKTLDGDYNEGHKSEYKTVYWTDPKSGERLHNPNTILEDVTGFVDQNYNPEGYIEKTVTFDDIDVDNANNHPSSEEPPIGKTILLQRANEVLAQSANVSVREFSISMVDLSLLSHTNREPFVSNTSKYVDLGYTDEEIIDNQESEQLTVYDRSTGISKTIIPKIFDKVVCTYYNPDRTYICEYSDGLQSNIWRRATSSDGYHMTSGWGDHSADPILSTNNFIDIGHRVPFRCEAYSINDTDSTPWICTSLDMSIDNPAASRYTFSVMDVNYMPNENFKISEQTDPSKSRTNTTAKPTSGTPVEKESQPTDIVKIDDNHVVEYYPDREVHYVADGTDNTRSNITTYEMPLGTTPITRGNPEPEPEE